MCNTKHTLTSTPYTPSKGNKVCTSLLEQYLSIHPIWRQKEGNREGVPVVSANGGFVTLYLSQEPFLTCSYRLSPSYNTLCLTYPDCSATKLANASVTSAMLRRK